MERKRLRNREGANGRTKSRRIEWAVEHVLSRFTWNNTTTKSTTKKSKKKTTTVNNKKKKTNTTKTTTNKKINAGTSMKSKNDSTRDNYHRFSKTWDDLIPPEILVTIFQIAIDDEGPMPLLQNLAMVCKKWYAVSRTPVLWKHLDMSSYSTYTLKPEVVTSHLFSKQLMQVQKVTIQNRNDISNKFISDLCKACGKTLTSLEFTQCQKLTDDVLGHVTEHCQKITSLSLDRCSKICNKTVNLTSLLMTKGADIETFVLTNVQIQKSVSVIFHTIMANCPNLTYLDMSNIYCMGMSLNVELFQISCPKLRILILGDTRFAPTHDTCDQMASVPGFLHLEELSIAFHTDSFYVCNHFIRRILAHSPNLKYLDLRGCKPVTADVFDLLQLPKLQSLILRRSTIITHDGLVKIANKWKQTLRQLDIAWVPLSSERIDEGVRNLLSERHLSNLSSLNISGTSIEHKTLLFLLDNSMLTSLNLTSCKGLPRGTKRWHDQESIELLKRKLLSDYMN